MTLSWFVITRNRHIRCGFMASNIYRSTKRCNNQAYSCWGSKTMDVNSMCSFGTKTVAFVLHSPAIGGHSSVLQSMVPGVYRWNEYLDSEGILLSSHNSHDYALRTPCCSKTHLMLAEKLQGATIATPTTSQSDARKFDCAEIYATKQWLRLVALSISIRRGSTTSRTRASTDKII